MQILDLMKERVLDVVSIQNNSLPIKQIKYREKLRQLSESDMMSNLFVYRKLTQSDLAIFQEQSKFILRTLVPGFEPIYSAVTLTATSKVFIELYHFCGFQQRAESLYNELLQSSKQQIFLSIISHLLDLTKLAMQTAIKRFLDMKLFCIGVEKPMMQPQLSVSMQMQPLPTSMAQMPQREREICPPKRRLIDKQARSDSIVIEQPNRNHTKALSNLPVIERYGSPMKEQNTSQRETTTMRELTQKDITQRDLTQRENIYTQRDTSNERAILKKFDRFNEPLKLILPSLSRKELPTTLLQQLKNRNIGISLTIQNYIKQLQKSGFVVE